MQKYTGFASVFLSSTVINLRHLRCFVAVVSELNFTKAAESLNISQPPLSRAIRELEDELGFPLFERDRHSVRLTKVGCTFATEAQRVLSAFQNAVYQARQVGLHGQGSLSVGISPDAVISSVGRYLNQFSIEHPEFEVDCRELPMTSLISAIQSGKLDVGFYYVRERARGGTPVQAPEQVYVVMSPTNPLAALTEVSLPELRGETLLLGTDVETADSSLHELRDVDAMYAPKVVMASSMAAAIGLARSGIGITFVPDSLRIPKDGITYIPLTRVFAQLIGYWLPERAPLAKLLCPSLSAGQTLVAPQVN